MSSCKGMVGVACQDEEEGRVGEGDKSLGVIVQGLIGWRRRGEGIRL